MPSANILMRTIRSLIMMILLMMTIMPLPTARTLAQTRVTNADADIDYPVAAGRPSSHLWMQATWPLCKEGALAQTTVRNADTNIDYRVVAGRPSSHLWMQATWPLCMEGARRASTCATTLLCTAYTSQDLRPHTMPSSGALATLRSATHLCLLGFDGQCMLQDLAQ